MRELEQPKVERRGGAGPTVFRRVLVPVDLSPASVEELRYAVRLTEHFGSEIWLVHVLEPASFASGMEVVPLAIADQEVCRRAHRLVEGLLRREVEPLRRGGTLVRRGCPAREIVHAVTWLGIDLVVMSTHGYGAMQHLLEPSVAERVVRTAPCPVLTLQRSLLGLQPGVRHTLSETLEGRRV